MHPMAISIIIPTRNRNEILNETVKHAVTAAENTATEIIVVNDGASRLQLQEDLLPKIQVIENRERGVSCARNLGAEVSKGSILFFIDDDMWITEESIREISSLESKGVLTDSCVCLNWEYPVQLKARLKEFKVGRYILAHRYNTMEGRLHRKIDSTNELDNETSIGSCSFVISKHLFQSVGGYNEGIIFQGEDIDLSNRLRAEKIPVKILTKITAFHNHQDRLDIDGFLDRQYRGYFSQINAGIPHHFSTLKKIIYTLLTPAWGILKQLYLLIPNFSAFDVLSFRLIGVLSSLTYFRALKHSR
jgi:glycosyltransferase involved in cell wall biosynthesis